MPDVLPGSTTSDQSVLLTQLALVDIARVLSLGGNDSEGQSWADQVPFLLAEDFLRVRFGEVLGERVAERLNLPQSKEQALPTASAEAVSSITGHVEPVDLPLDQVQLGVQGAIASVQAAPILWTQRFWDSILSDELQLDELGSQDVPGSGSDERLGDEVSLYNSMILKRALTRAVRSFVTDNLGADMDIRSIELDSANKEGRVHAIYKMRLHFNGDRPSVDVAIPVSRSAEAVRDTQADFQGLKALKRTGMVVEPYACVTQSVKLSDDRVVDIECLFTEFLKEAWELSVQGNGRFGFFEPERADRPKVLNLQLGTELSRLIFIALFSQDKAYPLNYMRGDVVVSPHQYGLLKVISTAWRPAIERDPSQLNNRNKLFPAFVENCSHPGITAEGVYYLFRSLSQVWVKDLVEDQEPTQKAWPHTPAALLRGLLGTLDLYNQTVEEEHPKGLKPERFLKAFWTLYYTLRFMTFKEGAEGRSYYLELYRDLHEIATALGVKDVELHPKEKSPAFVPTYASEKDRELRVICKRLKELMAQYWPQATDENAEEE